MIKKGYDENRTHPNIWLAKNAHASYSLYEDIYEVDEPNVSDIILDVDYIDEPGYYRNDNKYRPIFNYDKLVNLGEIGSSPDTDNDGSPNAHRYNWDVHHKHYPHSNDSKNLPWLCFTGPMGDFWGFSTSLG